MKKQKNQLKTGIILSYANIAANAVVAICYTPVMLRLLGQSEYGLYTLVAGVVSFLSLFNFGAGGAYLRFYSRYKVKNDDSSVAKLNGTFMVIFMLLALIAVVAGGVLTGFSDIVFGSKLTGDELGSAKILMAQMVFNLGLTFPNTVFTSIITSRECYIFQRSVTLASTLFGPFVTLPLLLFGYKSVAIVSVSVAVTVFQMILNLYYCTKKIGAKFDFSGFDRKLVKEIFAFSFFVFLNMIIDQINWNVDKFLLGRFHGTNEVAVYGVASQINAIFISFSTSVSSVFAPRVNRLVAEGGTEDEVNRIFLRVGRLQTVIVLLFATGFVFFGQRAVELWAGKSYGEAYPTALLLVIPVLIPLVQNLGIEIQRAKNKHQFRSVVYTIIAAANIILSIPLCKAYGSVGSALGTAIAMLVGNGIIMNWYYGKHLDIDIKGFWRSLAGFLPAFIAPCVAGILCRVFVPFENNLLYLGCIAGYTVVYAASMWLFGLNKNEKAYVRKSVKMQK